MLLKILPFMVFLALGAVTLPVKAWPQAQPSTINPVRVGVYVSPPFVTKTDDGFTGMSVELWQSLANSLGLQSRYETFPTFGALVDATAEGKIDVAVTNLTITKGRAERIDFTYPWFDAGLRIMIADDRIASISDVLRGLKSFGYLRAYGWLAPVIVVATILLTLFDRRFDKDFPNRWRDGLANSFYTVMSVTTSGRTPSRKNLFGSLGRVWQAIWLVCGIAVLAYVTSSVTTVMTTLSLTNEINNLGDLNNRMVGDFTGSVAEEFVIEEGMDRRSYSDVDAAVAGLRSGRIDAIIGDAPVLEYCAHTHPDVPLDVVGAIFEPDKYCFAMPKGSALRR
ncbi:MAG: transporter substrate-binding domain-containing protein [Salaquimonas sp.]|nr:transporter substrate-binding domain-containing protein [Salaquimonas sp.]